MVEPEDLLGKADALMARHRRPARAGAEAYAEIPVLDDVVDLSREGDELPLLAEFTGLASEAGEQAGGPAASIRAAVLAALQPRIDSLIEARLKEGLAPLVERLFDELRGDLQLIARETLSDAVNTAVALELARRKSGS